MIKRMRFKKKIEKQLMIKNYSNSLLKILISTLSKYRTSKKNLKVSDKMIYLLKLIFGFS